MTKRVCIEPGCPELTDSVRCQAHTRQRDRERGSSTQRGYGVEHQAKRAAYQRLMDRGQQFTCWRCGQLIDPERWCLGHDDVDRSIWRGPECFSCNYSTASRRTPGGDT